MPPARNIRPALPSSIYSFMIAMKKAEEDKARIMAEIKSPAFQDQVQDASLNTQLYPEDAKSAIPNLVASINRLAASWQALGRMLSSLRAPKEFEEVRDLLADAAATLAEDYTRLAYVWDSLGRQTSEAAVNARKEESLGKEALSRASSDYRKADQEMSRLTTYYGLPPVPIEPIDTINSAR